MHAESQSPPGQFIGPWSLSVDPRDSSCWVADGGCHDRVMHLSADGAELWHSGTHAFAGPVSVSVNATDGACWVADMERDEVVHLRPRVTAQFGALPLAGTASLTVSFTGLSASGPASWAWDFGDGGASSEQHPSHTYTAAGSYTVSLTATNAAGSDSETKPDYITVTSQTWFEDDDAAISYAGAWSSYLHPSASAGHAAYSSQTGAAAEFTFTGTGIRCQLAKGPSMGKARVHLDGGPGLLVDLYSRTLQLTTLEKLGLPAGEHAVRMEVSGRKNRRSRGYVVDVDALEVVP